MDKADPKDCELNSQRTILMMNRLQYLRFAYLFTLEKIGENNKFNFKLCCEKAVQRMHKNGVRTINDPQVLMRWNRTYRISLKFPHPNVNIQNGYFYEPSFLETFPEVKDMIRKWANNNLDQLSCENIQLQIKNSIIPEVYKTYL